MCWIRHRDREQVVRSERTLPLCRDVGLNRHLWDTHWNTLSTVGRPSHLLGHARPAALLGPSGRRPQRPRPRVAAQRALRAVRAPPPERRAVAAPGRGPVAAPAYLYRPRLIAVPRPCPVRLAPCYAAASRTSRGPRLPQPCGPCPPKRVSEDEGPKGLFRIWGPGRVCSPWVCACCGGRTPSR